jgi:putative phosphoribosyl transferase
VAVVRTRVPRPFAAFRDRAEAGDRLALLVPREEGVEPVILALPRGGVAVAAPLARALDGPLLPIFARKLPLPVSPEMGFGAVAIDGTVVLNRPVVRSFGVTEREIDAISKAVRLEVERRSGAYGRGPEQGDVAGRRAIIVDDGLATGFSMIASARMVRKLGPAMLELAVPVSPADSLAAVEREFDRSYCLVVQEGGPFAVASFYRDFHDMSDEEVRRLLGVETGE